MSEIDKIIEKRAKRFAQLEAIGLDLEQLGKQLILELVHEYSDKKFCVEKGNHILYSGVNVYNFRGVDHEHTYEVVQMRTSDDFNDVVIYLKPVGFDDESEVITVRYDQFKQFKIIN